MAQFQEALDSQAAKAYLPTTLRSNMLQELPGVVRARARFSAAMVHAEYLGTIDTVLERVIAGELDPATALLEMDRSLGSLGFEPVAGRGTVRQHRSFARRNLILDTNLAQAGNYGQWIQNNTDTARDLYPCWEYYRAFDRQEPRDWRARWLAAGGSLYEGRMIATKDDPIWLHPALNRMGTPYPPFDFNSGMRLRPVRREDAERWGAISPDEDVLPAFQEFTAESMGAANLKGGLRTAVEDALQGIARFEDDGVLRMIEEDNWESLGLESAEKWDGPEVPELIDATAARGILEEGLALTDYNFRPVIFDGKMIDHWSGKKPRDVDGRLARLNWAVEAIDDPLEHWVHREDQVYLKLWGAGRQRRGVVVFIEPDGRAKTYFLERKMSKMDRVRRGALLFKKGGGQHEG